MKNKKKIKDKFSKGILNFRRGKYFVYIALFISITNTSIVNILNWKKWIFYNVNIWTSHYFFDAKENFTKNIFTSFKETWIFFLAYKSKNIYTVLLSIALSTSEMLHIIF